MDFSDTIIACATAQGRSGIAVIRLSGKRSFELIYKLTGKKLPSPRLLTRRKIFKLDSDFKRLEVIDDVLIVIFKSPESYNGEDIAEIHCHGSIAVISAIIEGCCDFDGVRLSKAGEFTRRAVVNNKQDIFQAEALIDLIDSETEQQRKLAVSIQTSSIIKKWQNKLLILLSSIEASIEFSDSDDLNPIYWRTMLTECRNGIKNSVDNNKGIAIRNGIKVVLFGLPNVGKSSIFNKLANKEIAIVSNSPGTTRDRLESALNINGYKVLLSDTAGLRHKTGYIESQGINKSLQAIIEADIIIDVKDNNSETYSESHNNYISAKKNIIYIINKVDLLNKVQRNLLDKKYILLSAKTDFGFGELHNKIVKELKKNFDTTYENVVITRIRHINILKKVIVLLEDAENEILLELSAEHIRLAYNILLGLNNYDKITMQGGSESVLDLIFSDFCIGK